VGPSGNSTEFFDGVFENVGAKAETGLPVSVVDVFGQFWGNWLPSNATYMKWSSVAREGSAFESGRAPMPIVLLAEVIPGQSPEIGGFMYPGQNATNGFNLTSYEVTPFEFGNWLGGRVQAFIPTSFVGTAMSNGTAQNSSECVENFDQITFIQGSTTDAFTAWFIDDFYNIPIFAKRGIEARQDSGDIQIPMDQENNPLVQLMEEVVSNFNQSFNQSLWATYPNPFQDYNQAMENVDELLLV
jgi:lysophospholipase